MSCFEYLYISNGEQLLLSINFMSLLFLVINDGLEDEIFNEVLFVDFCQI